MSKKDVARLYYIDEHIVRIIAAEVLALTVLAVVTGSYIPAVLLVLDFAARAFTGMPSLLAALARAVVALLQLDPRPVFAAPKKFAAILGFVFSAFLAVFLFLDYTFAAVTGGVILAVCALLESVFRICLGCYIYNWIVVPLVHRRSRWKKEPIR